MASDINDYLGQAKSALRTGATGQARDALLRILQDKPAHSRALALLSEVMERRLMVAPRPFTGAVTQRLMQLRDRSGPMAAAIDAAGISALNTKNADAVALHGGLLFEAGHIEPAHMLLRAALALNPDQVQANINLTNLYLQQKNLVAANNLIDQFVSRHPNDATGWTLVGLSRNELHQFFGAAEAFGKAHALAPGDLDIRQLLGKALYETDNTAAAKPILESVLAANPRHHRALTSLGLVALAEGDQPKAVACFHKVLEFAPASGKDYLNLSIAKKFRADDPDLHAMLRLAASSSLPDEERAALEFGIAKALEDVGHDDESFAHLERGNALRRADIEYSTEQTAALMEQTKLSFGKDATPARPDSDGPVPIFVLGMMRSGTTLTEQILSSHPLVAGAGELEQLGALAAPLAQGRPLTEDKVTEIRKAYLRTLAARAPGAQYVVDKMPANFRWIGLIRKALPEARIVHLNRDPMAVCWSIYKRYLPALGNGYAYRMDELAAFHDLYEDIMAFWRQQYPGEFFDLHYEALTKDPRKIVGELLEFCGLPWDEACLSPQDNRRAVRTASARQVRSGIYTGSSEAWQRWEKHLAPMIAHFAARRG